MNFESTASGSLRRAVSVIGPGKLGCIAPLTGILASRTGMRGTGHSERQIDRAVKLVQLKADWLARLGFRSGHLCKDAKFRLRSSLIISRLYRKYKEQQKYNTYKREPCFKLAQRHMPESEDAKILDIGAGVGRCFKMDNNRRKRVLMKLCTN